MHWKYLSLRAKTIFGIVKDDWMFPWFAWIASYLEKIKYVWQIQNNQAFISYKYQNS